MLNKTSVKTTNARPKTGCTMSVCHADQTEQRGAGVVRTCNRDV